MNELLLKNITAALFFILWTGFTVYDLKIGLTEAGPSSIANGILIGLALSMVITSVVATILITLN